MKVLPLVKISNMDEQKTAIDVREKIMGKMNMEGRSLQWLSNKTGIKYATLHSCVSRRLFALTPENLSKINEALGTTFAQNEN